MLHIENEQEYASKSSKLSRKYEEVSKFIQEMPPGRLEEIEGAIPCASDKLSVWKDRLLDNYTTIVISGDTKEAVVELTNTLCGCSMIDLELASSKTCIKICSSLNPSFIVHQGTTREKIIMYQKSMSNLPLADMKRYLKRNIDLLEINWPINDLEVGIGLLVVPVDISSQKNLAASLRFCIPPATGLMYHVTSNSENINIMRIKCIISSIDTVLREAADTRAKAFPPDCLLFSTIPNITSSKLTSVLPKIWKGVTEDNQVPLTDYSGPQWNRISMFCQSCNDAAIDISFSFLLNVLKRTYLILKGNLTKLSDTAHDNTLLYQSIMKSLVKVEKEPEEIRKEVEDLKEKEINLTIAKVSKFLTNPVTREKLFYWTKEDCPVVKGDSDTINATFLAKIFVRIREVINEWDSKSHEFEKMQLRLLEVFKSRFTSIEGQLANIENKLVNGEMVYSDGSSTESENEYVNMGFALKFQVALALSTNMPMGDVLDQTSIMDLATMMPKRDNPKQYIGYYEQNKEQEMKEITEVVIKSLLTDVGIKAILKDKVDSFVEVLNNLVQNIPELIRADKSFVENIMQGCDDADDKIRYIYYDKYSEAFRIQGDLALLYLTELRQYDFQFSDLDNWKDVIAEGTYGKVQLASLDKDSKTMKVAVKMMKEDLTADNAAGFLAEEDCLRRLQKPHIVKYYGSTYQELGGKCYPVMVMEYCPTTLDMHIIGPDVDCPGKHPVSSDGRKKSEQVVARWSYQICSGLMGIHQMGYMHRDLKPKNILIDESGVVKLTDLGLAKPQQEVKNTYCGTPSYMAPEILKGLDYTKAADMYSLSMILCEMWMGNYVDYLYKLPLEEIERGIRERKLRPRLYPNGPQGMWKDLIETCWSEDPSERYSANHCCKIFSKLMKP